MKSIWLIGVFLLAANLFAKESGKINLVELDVGYLMSTADSTISFRFADDRTCTISTNFLRQELKKSTKVVKFNVDRGIKFVGFDTISVKPAGCDRAKVDSVAWERAWEKSEAAAPDRVVQCFSPEPDYAWFTAPSPVADSAAPVADTALPLHGVTLSGIYFVAVALVMAVDGSAPAVKFETKWDRHPMTKTGDYYVFKTGRRFILPMASYCFDIGGGEYLPHVLKKGRGGAYITAVDSLAIIGNGGQNGYNFYTKPIKTDRFK